MKLTIAPEVQKTLAAGGPVVALESTLVAKLGDQYWERRGEQTVSLT